MGDITSVWFTHSFTVADVLYWGSLARSLGDIHTVNLSNGKCQNQTRHNTGD